MLGRKKKASLQSNGEFLSSLKVYYEDQIVRKRLSNDGVLTNTPSKEHDLSLSLSQLEFDDIEQNTYSDLMARLSSKKPIQKTSVPSTPTSINITSVPNTPITKASILPTRQATKHSITGRHQPLNQAPTFSSPSGFNPNSPIQSRPNTPSPTNKQPVPSGIGLSFGDLSLFSAKTPATSQQSQTTSPAISIQQPLFNIQQPLFNVQQPTSISPVHKIPIDPTIRQRRPSKSETPESSKFSYWVNSVTSSYEEYVSRVNDFKQNLAVIPLCNKVRMAIQETIDIHTVDDASNISSLSAALVFFQDLYQTGSAKRDDQPLPLTPDGKLFITMVVCERYLKRVIGQDTCIPFVATLFIVLSKNEPDLFNVLLSMVFSRCILPRLDTNQCLEQVLKISEGPAEKSAQWISDESSQFRLLIQVCSMTANKGQDPMSGQNLVQFLLSEALRAPAIPISTPFVINAILSTDMSNYQKKSPTKFADILKKSKEICELDWPTIIRSTLDANEMRFTTRSLTLMTAKNTVLIQGLKSTLSTFSH